MKKFMKVLLLMLFTLSFSSYASENKDEKAMMKKAQKESMTKQTKGLNIDKNNVANTLMEKPDQVDSDLIEGNLEDNDLKTN